jgi:hypothetical protein
MEKTINGQTLYQIAIWLEGDDADLDIYNASSLKEQWADRDVALRGHIFMVDSFSYSPWASECFSPMWAYFGNWKRCTQYECTNV